LRRPPAPERQLDFLNIVRRRMVRRPREESMSKQKLLLAALAASLAVPPAFAQQSAITRTPLQTVDFPAGYSTISAVVAIAPGGCAGRHNHPGIESTYVMEGTLTLKFDGKPEQQVKAGESFQIGPGVIHDPCNTSAQPVKIVVYYVVEKGKPAASPAP
jgi:quercetin dioxygenase-like cupin family protein